MSRYYDIFCLVSIIIATTAQAQLPMPDTLWTRVYGGISDDVCRSVKQSSDHGFVLGGYTLSVGAGNSDMLLAKTDSEGYLQWYRAIGGLAGDYAFAVVATLDEGCALAGQTSSYGTGTIDFYLVKTDALGNLQWQRTFGGGETYASRFNRPAMAVVFLVAIALHSAAAMMICTW